MQSSEKNEFRIELGRQDFPFLSFNAGLEICQIELIIETDPCQECNVIDVIYKNDELDDCDDIPMVSQRSIKLGGEVYHGVLVRYFVITDARTFIGDFCFPKDVEIRNVYLLVTYKANVISCTIAEDICC